MIIENISATVNSYTLNGKIIVPSPIMTATPQEENGDLTYAPNFQLKLGDNDKILKVTDIVNTSFTFGDYNYTSYMKVTNRSGDIATMQFVDGLTKEEDPQAQSITCDPSPVIVTFTIEDEQVTGDGNFSFSVIDNLNNDRSSEATVEWESISIVNIDLAEEYNYDREDLMDSGFVDPSFNSDTGKIEGHIDPNFFEYQWLNYDEGWNTAASFDVTVNNLYAEQRISFLSTNTDETNPQLSQSVNNILGSDYDVVNDMTEEDATNKANEILYGEES